MIFDIFQGFQGLTAIKSFAKNEILIEGEPVLSILHILTATLTFLKVMFSSIVWL